MNEVQKLIEQFNSSNWKDKLDAADKIGELKSKNGNQFLIEQLHSDDEWDRDAAALGIRETGNNEFFVPLISRILNLGYGEKIGTLVYALENFECSKALVEIIKLHVNGDAEVKMSTSTILQDQDFFITELDKKIINNELKKDDWTIDELEIKYSIK